MIRLDKKLCPVHHSFIVMSGRVGVRGLPLIHDKTVDEWGTEVLGYFMTGPPALS
jgi:hypothetical protein